MRLNIDDVLTTAIPDQTLRDILVALKMESDLLSDRPIAAKIAGEVFTLNYIPVRQKEAEADRVSIRRAMAASGGRIELLRFTDPSGRETYKRTAQFIIFLALRQ